MADSRQDGIDAAKGDLAAGVFRYKWTGSGSFRGNEFCRMVRDRFGIVVDHYDICIVEEDQTAFRRGYNETVREYMIAQYGRDVLEDAFAEAEARFAESYKRYVASLNSEEDDEQA